MSEIEVEDSVGSEFVSVAKIPRDRPRAPL